jgi:hypothetical protein
MKPFRSRVTVIWWTDAEMTLNVGFGGGLSEHVRIGMDESEVVTMLLG